MNLKANQATRDITRQLNDLFTNDRLTVFKRLWLLQDIEIQLHAMTSELKVEFRKEQRSKKSA